MEHASTLSEMPWEKDLRAGQRKTVGLFGPTKTKVVTQLPTGYGKTRTAACAYLRAKATIGVNRVLYIAPKAGQVKQAAEDFPKAIRDAVGGKPMSHVVGDNPITALKAHRNQAAEIFITTVQALVSSERTMMCIREMMQTGRWMVIIDEHHHYGDAEDSVWTQKVLSLPSNSVLAMSATPTRSDGSNPIGEPDVEVKYLDAFSEGCVKRLSLHVYEYRVDAITINGDIVPFTTGELFREAGSMDPADIDKFMASRQMKWSPKYISPLVLHPLERINDLFITKSIKAQMLVQAISCSHAKMVCEQIRAIIPKAVSVDWCGTGPNGRSQEENDDVIARFCPPKDSVTDKRNWTLDILVNVGIASEGLDTNDVCEIVFLTSPSINNTTKQTIGRGARLHQRTAKNDQPLCTINVDSASDLAEFIGEKIMHVFDVESASEIETEDSDAAGLGAKEYEPLPDDLPQVGVLDVTLVDIRKDPMFQGVMALTEKALRSSPLSEDDKARLMQNEVERQVREFMRTRDERFNATAIEAQTREKVDAAVRKVAGMLVRRASDAGLMVEKSAIGDLIRRINSQKKMALGAIDSADVSDLERHWRWIKQIETQILNKETPSWLR